MKNVYLDVYECNRDKIKDKFDGYLSRLPKGVLEL
jgi:hypothetical protein